MTSINRGARYALAAGAAVATVVLAIVFFPWNALRGPLAGVASQRLDRPVTIAGDLGVKLGWTTSVQIDDVSIGNVDWSKDQPMVHTKSAVFVYSMGLTQHRFGVRELLLLQQHDTVIEARLGRVRRKLEHLCQRFGSLVEFAFAQRPQARSMRPAHQIHVVAHHLPVHGHRR